MNDNPYQVHRVLKIPEVLRFIFCYRILVDTPVDEAVATALTLASVCREWRLVAISCQALWNKLYIRRVHHHHLLRLFRTRSSPLAQLVIHVSPKEDIHGLMQESLSVIAQCRTAKIGPIYAGPVFVELPSLLCESLQDVRFSHVGFEMIDSVLTMLRLLPNLRFLEFNTVILRRDSPATVTCPVVMHNLRRLRVTGPVGTNPGNSIQAQITKHIVAKQLSEVELNSPYSLPWSPPASAICDSLELQDISLTNIRLPSLAVLRSMLSTAPKLKALKLKSVTVDNHQILLGSSPYLQLAHLQRLSLDDSSALDGILSLLTRESGIVGVQFGTFASRATRFRTSQSPAAWMQSQSSSISA